MLNRNGRYPDDPCLRRYRLRLYARCRIALGVTPKSRAMRAVRSPVRYLLRARCFCAGDSFHVRITRSPRSHSSLAPRVAARQANSKNEHTLVRTQSGKHSDLSLQRPLQNLHPHTRRKSARLRQFDETVTFTRLDLSDDSIRNMRRLLTVHD